LARGREAAANGQRSAKPALRASSREFIVKGRGGGAEAGGTVVRGIQRPKYSSTCYVNAALQALFHVQGFSNFLEGHNFGKDRHPLLLQLQKLYHRCRSTQGGRSANGSSSNKEVIDCLNLKGININPKRQEDSTEFFERLVEEVASETRNDTEWRGVMDVKEMLRANIACTVACKTCGHGDVVDYTHTTVHLELTQAGQVDTTISRKVHDLLRRKETTAVCSACRQETRSENTFSYQMSESLFLRVARNTWNSKKGKMERAEQKVRPEKSFDLKSEHHGHKTRYSLTGGIVHRGGASSGHYLNVLLISRKWYEIDDEQVRIIPEDEAIRLLEGHGVLVMYQRERGSGGEGIRSSGAVSGATQGRERPKQEHARAGLQAKRPTRGGRRHRFFRPYGTRRSDKPRKGQWGKSYVPDHKGYYDPDKKCFYIPKL
jgi:ubiquitin C-terminal hydrolase